MKSTKENLLSVVTISMLSGIVVANTVYSLGVNEEKSMKDMKA